jgi:hypothetical protein
MGRLCISSTGSSRSDRRRHFGQAIAGSLVRRDGRIIFLFARVAIVEPGLRGVRVAPDFPEAVREGRRLAQRASGVRPLDSQKRRGRGASRRSDRRSRGRPDTPMSSVDRSDARMTKTAATARQGRSAAPFFRADEKLAERDAGPPNAVARSGHRRDHGPAEAGHYRCHRATPWRSDR